MNNNDDNDVPAQELLDDKDDKGNLAMQKKQIKASKVQNRWEFRCDKN